MVRTGRPEETDAQQSLGELVASAMKDVSSLVRNEISLAKSELKLDARRIGIAAGLAVVSLFVLFLILILLCIAAAYALAIVLPHWAAFLVVAGGCLLLIAVAGLIAWGRIRKVTGMKLTRKTVMDDIGALRRSEPSPNGTAVGPAAGGTAQIPPARS